MPRRPKRLFLRTNVGGLPELPTSRAAPALPGPAQIAALLVKSHTGHFHGGLADVDLFYTRPFKPLRALPRAHGNGWTPRWVTLARHELNDESAVRAAESAAKIFTLSRIFGNKRIICYFESKT